MNFKMRMRYGTIIFFKQIYKQNVIINIKIFYDEHLYTLQKYILPNMFLLIKVIRTL